MSLTLRFNSLRASSQRAKANGLCDSNLTSIQDRILAANPRLKPAGG